MKKTLILLFVVLMTATLFVACSSSPEKENYAVKVVLEGLEDEDVDLGIDGTYYMKDTAIDADDTFVYILYSDPMCESETDLCLYLRQSSDTKYRVRIERYGVSPERLWTSEEKTATSSIATLSVKASDSIVAEGYVGDEYDGTATMYARENVVLTINESY